MVPISLPETEVLARVLASYSPRATIARTAGLLTVPQLQANTIRLELLVHLAVVHCAGKRRPEYAQLARWLNHHLGNTGIEATEDPVEDVFITNINTPKGGQRLFEGVWESNDYFLQVVMDTLLDRRTPRECRDLLGPALALLQLSDRVAQRVGLNRWHTEPSVAKGQVTIAPATLVSERARAVTFTNSELEELGIDRNALSSFILFAEDKNRLASESTGHSSLERRPLIDFGDALILALPSAVSPAIRRFTLSRLRELGHLGAFAHALAGHQARQLEDDGLWELKGEADAIEPPPPDNNNLPSFHGWLLKYDVDKYIHVVLLDDRLDWLEEQGLSSFLELPAPLRTAFQQYLNKVAMHCMRLSDCSEGMTLIVLGGLGRGFMLGFDEWPDSWRLSVIRISDLLMLGRGLEPSVKRYLKCFKQKEWAEAQGIAFFNINGDFNFYCYWSQLNFQLVPRETPVGQGAMISVAHDFVFPVRTTLRTLTDEHLLQTIDGRFAQVMRYGRDAYFKSMQGRPIYVSPGHLRAGILAGAIETSRGPSWLVITPREGNETVRHLLYQMWSGFVGIFDRLVSEVELLIPRLISVPIEIRLNFSAVEVFDSIPAIATVDVPPPEVTLIFHERRAEIRFPAEFLVHFQKPENTGEKMVVRAIALGLLSLHYGPDAEIDPGLLDTLVAKVIGDKGARVLHVFQTYYAIEHLLAKEGQKPTFLAHEEFVFAKLKLSDGCADASAGGKINSKTEVNDFLHKVVEKIWHDLRDLLHQFDRSSVIQSLLRIHEAVLHDREHWRRTAQAVISLYSSAEDIFAVAQLREKDRNQVALPARALLEMAICECPASGGREVSRWALDELLAKAALLIDAATDSDAVMSDLVAPIVELHRNGEYGIDRAFYQTVIQPFVANFVREEFEEAAAEYNELYRRERPTQRTRADEVFSGEFINAFKAEYGLIPDEAVDAFGELMELAVEQDSVVVGTTVGTLKSRLRENRGMSEKSVDLFLKMFGLTHRDRWEQPPNGFNSRDLYPWRFRRRLSATVRPLLIFGEQNEDKIFYGAGGLRLGFGYLFERAERGHLPERFFTTSEMRKYIGSTNDERGHLFAKSVAERLGKRGWQTRSEVQMTELGASAEFGDIDVLAWKPTGQVVLVECKRLQLARTIAEIAEVCGRFKGEARDELDKHMRRIEWVTRNSATMARVVGFVPQPDAIDSRLVTNTHVPMMYLSSLPVAADKIGPLDRLSWP